MAKRERVRITEVGARDGLQNEKREVPTAAKVRFIRALAAAGLKDIELGAMVRPDRVPQMADSEKVVRRFSIGASRSALRRGWVLVPNLKGLERAIDVGARDVAVFTAASDGFNRRNIGMSVRESLVELERVVREAKRRKMRVRGYVSTAFYCPYEGRVQPARALAVMEKVLTSGVEEVSVGDTIGAATPREVEALFRPAFALLGGPEKFAGHFHDTRGTALANTLRALDLGMRSFDSSAGGLGGCPFAPGAAGNLATEDLVYLLEGMGFETGVDLAGVCRASLRLRRDLVGPPIEIRSRFLAAFAKTGRIRP